MKHRFLTLLIVAAFALPTVSAKLGVANIFGDGMVLQQNSRVDLRGYADPGAKLTVKPQWAAAPLKVCADADGRWTATVATPTYGGPYSLTIAEDCRGGEKLTLGDILIGEVWLCSGQSNMEMPVRGFRGQPVKGSAKLIAEANPRRQLRLYRQPNAWSTVPVDDIEGARWTTANSADVADFSAAGYVFADQLQRSLEVPVGIIQCAWSMSTIEAWMPRSTFESQFPDIDMPDVDAKEFGWTQGTPTLLWNAMVAPWKGFPIAGVIWYQGEANSANPNRYERLFPAMVADWRSLFANDTLPFYAAQIAPWRDQGCQLTQWAAFRKAQSNLARRVNHHEIVTTGDLGDSIFIHFPRKIEVGQRFAYLALENDYDVKGLDSRAPSPIKVSIDGHGDFIVEFSNGRHGLTPENQNLDGFEVVDGNGAVHQAEATILNGDWKVKIKNPGVVDPRELRYGYHNYFEASLFNNIGIPAEPFRLTLPVQ